MYDIDADVPLRDHYVTQSNALVRAGQTLTLGEKRIVAAALAKLDTRKPPNPREVPPPVKITAAEYAETFDVTLDTAYDQLASAAAHLYRRSVTFYKAAPVRKGKPLPPTRVTTRWVTQVHYQQGEAWVELHWVPQIMKHLVGMKARFTQYQLKQAAALRSIHSWRMLELFKSYDDKGGFEMDIEDFAETMKASETQRKNFGQMRLRVIEPAVKELREKDGWIVEWKAIKGGRRVKALRFSFQRDPQERLF